VKPYVAFGIAVLAGFLWLRLLHDPSVRADALQDVRDDSLRSELALRDSALVDLSVREHGVRTEVSRLRSRLENERSQIENWRDSANAYSVALDSLLRQLPATDSALVVSITGTIRGLEGQRDTCMSALASCDSLQSALTVQVSMGDTARVLLQKSLDGIRGAWEEAVKERNRY